jgi:hypothetical protein
MEHIHKELINKWINDTDLVILEKSSKSWFVSDDQTTPEWKHNTQYYVVCEQHVRVCLHWLNGGNVQISSYNSEQYFDITTPEFEEFCEYRIAVDEPTKAELVKVWVGVIKPEFKESTAVMKRNISIDFHYRELIPDGGKAYTWTEVEVNRDIA